MVRQVPEVRGASNVHHVVVADPVRPLESSVKLRTPSVEHHVPVLVVVVLGGPPALLRDVLAVDATEVSADGHTPINQGLPSLTNGVLFCSSALASTGWVCSSIQPLH